MKYEDANGHSIRPGFYFETFCKGKDEFRNRIVWVTRFVGYDCPYVVTSQAKPTPLNTNYSKWLIPVDDEKQSLAAKLCC